jgi:hypothetical protein
MSDIRLWNGGGHQRFPGGGEVIYTKTCMISAVYQVRK